MPKEIYKVLGQERPAAATEVVLYTVPDNRRAIVKVTAFVSGANADINIAVVPDGDNDIPTNPTAGKNYIVEALPLTAKNSAAGGSLNGITLNEKDDIRVESDVVNTIFHCYGVELEP